MCPRIGASESAARGEREAGEEPRPPKRGAPGAAWAARALAERKRKQTARASASTLALVGAPSSPANRLSLAANRRATRDARPTGTYAISRRLESGDRNSQGHSHPSHRGCSWRSRCSASAHRASRRRGSCQRGHPACLSCAPNARRSGDKEATRQRVACLATPRSGQTQGLSKSTLCAHE